MTPRQHGITDVPSRGSSTGGSVARFTTVPVTDSFDCEVHDILVVETELTERTAGNHRERNLVEEPVTEPS
jgi:hypothetical protein